MRTLLDANVFISYLLRPTGDTPPIATVGAAFSGAYTLLMTAGIAAEIREKTATKPYLTARITPTDLERLVGLINVVAETVPELDRPFPEIGRDRKDDYLFAHAVVAHADYLVSGDRDVLSVGRIGNVQIISPTEFQQVLRHHELI